MIPAREIGSNADVSLERGICRSDEINTPRRDF